MNQIIAFQLRTAMNKYTRYFSLTLPKERER